MTFIHYKDFQPLNLDKVGTIGKENQQLPQGITLYAVVFYDFERKVGYWAFQNEEERDRVYEWIRSQYSREVGKVPEPSKQTAVFR